MKRCKLYSIPINFSAIFFLVGCYTTYDHEFLKNELSDKSVLFSPYEDRSILSPAGAFNHYCTSGRQIRDLTTHLQAVLPKLPPNIPLDRAAQYSVKILKIMRDTAQRYYLISPESRMYVRYLIAKYSTVKSYKMIDDQKQDAIPPIIGMDKTSHESYLNLFKVNPIPESNLPVKHTREFLRDAKATIIQVDSDHPILVGLVPLPHYQVYNPYRDFRGIGLGDRLTIDNIDGFAYGVVGSPSKKKLSTNNEAQPEIFPIMRGFPLEPNLFSGYFTMLIPSEVQNKIWNKSNTRRYWRTNYFIKWDGSYDLEEAINSRRQIFNQYIERFTTVKEAQSEDPQIIDFHVTLDLQVFCQYAKPVEDLVSK